jgi:hypothetical protein
MSISRSKGLKIAAIILFIPLCLCSLSICILVFAYNSNYNVPVASDIVEKIENTILTEEGFKQMISDSLKRQITEPVEIQKTGFKSFSANISSTISGESEGTETIFESKGTITGAYDGSKVAFETDLDLETAGVQMKSDLELRSFTEGNNNELFIKLNKLPAVFTTFVPVLGEINNKWVYTETDVSELNQSESIYEDPELRDAIVKLADTDELLDLFNRSENRVINNVRTYCFSINVDQVKYNALVNKYSEITGEESSALSTIDFELNGELCIGRKDLELYYASVDFVTQDAEGSILVDNISYSMNELELSKPKIDIRSEDLDFSTLML